MGTIIPLGPGLTALVQVISKILLIILPLAFDAAVLGMASAAIAFTVSKIGEDGTRKNSQTWRQW